MTRPRSRRLPRGLGTVGCPESRSITELLVPPVRRVRCATCRRLVRLVRWNGVVIVPPHNVPPGTLF